MKTTGLAGLGEFNQKPLHRHRVYLFKMIKGLK
jgi:hypothetical protein